MSYILDSLKKSEKQRSSQKSEIPGLNSDHELPRQKKRPVWVWLVLSIFALNILILTIFLNSGSKTPDPVDETSSSIDSVMAESAQVDQPPEAQTSTTTTGDSIRPGGAPIPAEIEVGQSEGEGPAPGIDSISDQEVKVRLFSELPPDLIGRLSELEMTLHYYSSQAARRMVRINGRNLHQGDILQPQVEVLEITIDGAILDVFGYRVWVEKP